MWWSWFVCSTLIPGLLGCNGPCNESENAKCAWKSHSMGLRVAVAGPAIINAHYFQVMLRNKMLVLEHVFKEPGPGRPPGEGGFSAASWMRRSKLLKIWGSSGQCGSGGQSIILSTERSWVRFPLRAETHVGCRFNLSLTSMEACPWVNIYKRKCMGEGFPCSKNSRCQSSCMGKGVRWDQARKTRDRPQGLACHRKDTGYILSATGSHHRVWAEEFHIFYYLWMKSENEREKACWEKRGQRSW